MISEEQSLGRNSSKNGKKLNLNRNSINKVIQTFCDDEINGNIQFGKAVVCCTEILSGIVDSGADNFQFRAVGRHLEPRPLL